jgi:2-oxoisovalerate dehydrogenase E2 component (dihydrolipoyl transacylase)
MAKFTFNMPDVGEGVAEAEVIEWHVKVGDRVEEDQHLVDVMTDKATIDIESPVTGTVVAVAGEVGDVIAIGAMLLVIEVEGEDNAAEEAEAAAEQIEDEMSDADEADVAPAPEPVAASAPAQPEPAQPAPEAPAPAAAAHKVLASPAVRQRARDLGVDLAAVKPAEDGRVRHGDLDAFLAYNAGSGFGAAGKARADETVKVIGLRKRIAQNMAAAKRHIPHFTYVEECDVTDLEVLRAQLNEGRGAGEGGRPKLTMLPLLITAICKTIPAFPMINARYDDEAGVVTRYGSVHLGISAQTTSGLMVPVIRDAQSRNLWQLARAGVAQLVRASACHAEGRGFEPRHSRHFPEPRAGIGEADQRHKQHIRHQRLGHGVRLQHPEGADRKIALVIGVGVMRKDHRCIARGKAGQGEGVAGLVKEPRIACRRGLVRARMIEADDGFIADPRQQWCRRAMEQQAANGIGQGLDMRLARGTQGATEFGFGRHALLQPQFKAVPRPKGP